jgi:phenylacetate-CoA ligase
MPLIRYRLGDVCIPTDEECTCGVTLPLIKTPEGRADDFLVTVDGRLISPMAFSPFPFEEGMEGVKQFRVVQEKRDKLTIQLALQEGFSPSHEFLENARKEIQRLFGKEMRVEFEILDRIDLGLTGKLNTIVSRVDD